MKTDENSSMSGMIGLTARQQQALVLMQQGKANKEIAKALDISLGTVKQHLAAVFKKLNVKNRTMAVARLAEFKDQSRFNPIFSQEILIARRPALVLSLKIEGQLSQAALKLFDTYMSDIAFDNHALFISREWGDGTLIFGLKRSSTQYIRTVIQAAQRVFYAIKAFITQHLNDEAATPVFTGALVAGLTQVSQNRFGGWSGESVGSNLLTCAYKLRENAQANCLIFDANASSAIQAFDLILPSNFSNQLAFSKLHYLNGWNVSHDTPLVGREKEFEFIKALLAKDYSALFLEGENGMGKSRLCREAGRLAIQVSCPLFYIHILPSGGFESEHFQHLKCLIQVFYDLKTKNKGLLIIDDAHHLTTESKTTLTHFLNNLPKGLQVIISGRRPQSYAINEAQQAAYRLLHLGRMDDVAILAFINKLPSAAATALVKRARGIPLFAKELLQSTDENPVSLALMVTIASRIDKFKIDWKLLYCVASQDKPISLEQLVTLMHDDLAYIKAAIKQTETLGVLTYQSGTVSFRHPLVQNVISYLFGSNATASARGEY